ncbi:probable G-protein coupled receptor Mth-like 2 isoform X2 [Drosophila biarmipes]|uniref:probable G-protein coupled receptor Mth-like 2 isoform X2 n=1 Tax=Drosophila biarmipes TaxID=125945 RepID=UPI0021CC9307|nr:probable G-protein coupled receptor Mth-like 2 isoform X2 [Drosophila biarmipes]
MGLLIGLVAGFVLLMLPNSNAEIVGCDFFDTVDISEGKRLANGSVLYEDLLIPADLTGEYDFKLLGNGSKEAVASHIRGCVCQLRSCVRFCCPHNHLIKWGACNSNTTTDELSNVDPFLSVTLNNGSVVKMHYRKDLVVQWDLPKPCQEADLYFLDDQVEMEKYTLLENETLLRHFDSVILDKADYCFQHLLSEDGFLGYFFVMAVFFWLSVISLDLFNGMKGVLVSENRFLAYNCYAWGMSVALTVVTFLADKFVENQDWNPRMGALGFCWIYTKEWSAMLYFFGPILVLILFNMTLFILMAIPLISSKRALRKFARKEGRKQKLKSDKQNYALFLRLFVVMGLTWSLEIISYLVQNTKWAKALLVADYLNWSLGLVIFVVFIMRTSTLDLLKMQILPKHQRSGLSIKSKVSRTTTAESLSQYPGPNQSFSMQNSSSA